MRASFRSCLYAAVFLTGCTLDSPGLDPPGPFSARCAQSGLAKDCTSFYFPSALALSHSGDFLYMANANFDLRYNGATVLALSTANIAAAVRDTSDASAITMCGPVRCIPTLVPPNPAIEIQEIRAGSYVSGLALSGDDSRLYMAVRAEGNLTWIDLAPDGTMNCWAAGMPEGVCDPAHRLGNDTYANARAIVLPSDPVRLDVVPYSLLDPSIVNGGDAVLLADRTGAVTLFFDDNGQSMPTPGMSHAALGPSPISVLSGLHGTVTALAFDPITQRAWVGSGYDAVTPSTLLSRVGVVIDPMQLRSYVYDAGKVPLAGVDDGTDVRDIVFDPRPGSHRMYVLARAPQAVILADLSLDPEVEGTLPVVGVVPIDVGPSRLEFAVLGAVDGVGGRALLFATCYDARTVYILDADTGALVNVVRGLGGPYDMAIDERNELLYVTDFRSSTLRVVDLAPLAPGLMAAPPTGAYNGELVVTSLGAPTPPQALM